jgi:hypothetical protein
MEGTSGVQSMHEVDEESKQHLSENILMGESI